MYIVTLGSSSSAICAHMRVCKRLFIFPGIRYSCEITVQANWWPLQGGFPDLVSTRSDGSFPTCTKSLIGLGLKWSKWHFFDVIRKTIVISRFLVISRTGDEMSDSNA